MSKTKALDKYYNSTDLERAFSDEQLANIRLQARHYEKLLKDIEKGYQKSFFTHFLDAAILPDFIESKRPQPGRCGLDRDKQRINAYFAIAMEKTVAQEKK